jgi:hypothetical protein
MRPNGPRLLAVEPRITFVLVPCVLYAVLTGGAAGPEPSHAKRQAPHMFLPAFSAPFAQPRGQQVRSCIALGKDRFPLFPRRLHQENKLCLSTVGGGQEDGFPPDVRELITSTSEGAISNEALLDMVARLRTPAATCLRVNTLRASPSDIAHQLAELCEAECGFRPTIYSPRAFPECLILPRRDGESPPPTDAASMPDARGAVLVGRLCGEAVLQGAHVFAAGVAAAPHNLTPGQEVEVFAPPPPPPRTKWTRRIPHPVLIGHAASLSQVFADTTDAVQRGGCTGGRKATDVRIESPGRAVWVGRGRAEQARGALFGPDPSGVAVTMTARRFVAPPPFPPRTKWTRRVPHPVLIGHAASLTPY